MKRVQATHRLIHSPDTRNPDHETSLQAAATVGRRRRTIRDRVVDFALRCPHGFIDEEVGMLDPDAPESSFRKRRTELADENLIVASEETRRNSKGQDCIVWRHRCFLINPPPQKPRETKPSRFAQLQEENARLRAQVDQATEQERSTIVQWLRARGNPHVDWYADRIARREHHR